MLRIHQKPIIINEGVKVENLDNLLHFIGVKGKLNLKIPASLKVEVFEKQILVRLAKGDDSQLLGLYRSLIRNAAIGVSTGFQKALELVGTGFRAETNGQELILSLGFSHPIKITAEADISFQVLENKIIISGVDKYLVGEVAAKIRRLKPPEPYKGKGIRYANEFIRKKLGKAAKAVGAIGSK